jgi:5-methylcytosine-specific restriction endonuclease McrA
MAKQTKEERKAKAVIASRKYYIKNRDRILAQDKIRHQKNKEESRKRYQEKKEKIKEQHARYRKENPSKMKKCRTRWQKNNTEKSRAATARWYKENPEKTKAINHNNRARRAACEGKLSSGIAERLLAFQKNRCAVCRASLKRAGYHLDHVIPLARGGKNVDRNIQLTCPKCNQKKHAKDPIAFMQERGFLL